MKVVDVVGSPIASRSQWEKALAYWMRRGDVLIISRSTSLKAHISIKGVIERAGWGMFANPYAKTSNEPTIIWNKHKYRSLFTRKTGSAIGVSLYDVHRPNERALVSSMPLPASAKTRKHRMLQDWKTTAILPRKERVIMSADFDVSIWRATLYVMFPRLKRDWAVSSSRWTLSNVPVINVETLDVRPSGFTKPGMVTMYNLEEKSRED